MPALMTINEVADGAAGAPQHPEPVAASGHEPA